MIVDFILPVIMSYISFFFCYYFVFHFITTNWYNKKIKSSSKPIYLPESAKQSTIFLCDLFNAENKFKT